MKRIYLSSFPALLFAALLGFLFSAGTAKAQVSPAAGCHWLSFDGSNDYVSVANNSTLNPGTNSFSVAGWFRAGNTPAANRILIAKRAMNDGPGNPGFALFLTTAGELRAIIEDGSAPILSVQTAATYQDNIWRHVAVNFVRSGGNFEIFLYVNGVQVASVGPLAMADSPNNTRPVTIGAALNNANALQFPLGGELDDFALWRRALSPTEIDDLYNGVVTPDQLTSQLRAYWPFEEGIGTTTDDASPNNNIGTLTNGPTWQNKTIPTATLFSASPSTFCEGGTTTISFGINNGSTYLWTAVPSVPGVVTTFNNPTSQNPGALTVTNVPDGPPITVDVSVSVTSADGCQITSNVIMVTVRPNPETQPILGEDEPCIGSMETYTMLNNGSSYTWSIAPSVAGNSLSTMNNTATVTWGHATPGTYTITAIETDANGCATTNTLSATTKPTPTVNVLPNQGPFCEGNTVPGVTVTGTPGATFSWEITGDNTGWSSSTGTGDVPSFTAMNGGSNILVSTVTVTATLNGCDSQPVSYTVTVNPSPDLTYSNNPSICFGESFELQDLLNPVNLSDINNVNGVVSVHSTLPTDGSNQIQGQNTLVTPTSDITYYYRKTGTASPGCFDELAVTLFVEGPITINSIIFQNNQPSICEGSNTYIEVSATNAGSGTLAYQWQVNDGNGWMNVDISSPNYSLPAAQNGARLRILNAPLAFDGLEYRCLVSTAECPAVISPEMNLTVTPLPNIIAVTETPVTCNGGSNGSMLFAVPQMSDYEYFLNPGSSFSGPAVWKSAAVPFNIEGNLTAGDYNLRLRDAATLCFIDQLITIAEPDPITFSVAVQDASCNGGSDGTLTVSAMGGNASPYSYRINGGAPQSSNVFTGLTAGTYNVEVFDGFDPSCIAGPQTYTISEPTALEVDPDIMDLTCFESANGMIEPMAAGGTPPYSYSWSGPNGYSSSFNGTLYVNNFDTNLNGFTDQGGNFVDVDPMLTNGSVVNEYWSQNTNNDRAITFYKANNADVVYWEIELTNTTGQVINDLSIQYDLEVHWIANNNGSRSARLSWEVVGSGSPALSSILANSTTAPTNTWLTDAQMDAFSLALRNQVNTLTGLNIAPGANFTVRVSGATDNANRRDMNHGVDNLTISSGNFSGKISDLEAGNYLLTLSDALGCTLDSTITVTQPDELTIDLEPVPHICIDDMEFTLPYSALGGLTNFYQIENDPAFAGMDAGDLALTNTGFQVLGASPLTISLNSAPPASGFYHMLVTPRSTGPTCTGAPIPFTVYVPNPNNTPVAQVPTICSGAAAVIDVTTTELEVPSGLRWVYNDGVQSPVFFETFDANGAVQISQVLTNTTTAPITVNFIFRAYTYGPDGIDDNGEPMTDDCRQNPTSTLSITVLPEPAGSATASVVNDPICSGSDVVIEVSSPIMSSSYFWVADGVAGSSTVGATMVSFMDDIVEPLMNTTDDYLTATYTITPYTWGPNGIDDGGTGDDCLGDPVVVTVDVEPEPNASANLQTPEICSGDQAIIDVTTSLQIANTRYRWRAYPAGSPSGGFNNNNLFGTQISQVLTNTSGVVETITFEIRPYSFGPNGNNNNGSNDDCTGTTIFVTVDVQPEPVLNPPTFVRVCSDAPLNYNLPGTDINGVPIIGYDIVSKTVASGLVVVNAATVPATMVSANYLANDLYSNPTSGIRVVEYTVIPYSNQNCVGDTAVYTFRIAPEPKVSGSANPQAPEELIVCSGGDLDKALIGYLGNTPGSMSNPDVSFHVELFNPFNLQLVSSNTYPATCLPANGIENDVFLNFSNTSRFVFYTITPVTNCGNASLECQGTPVFIQVEVEPAPQAALSLNLNGNVSPILNIDNFVACSESNFNITGTSNTNPSNPAHAIWAQVEISGDVETLGFAPGTVILHGPLGNLNVGTTSLINTTTNPVVINFSIIPYIETTPSIDPIAMPQTLSQDECAGQATSFTITINPEPDHDDETLSVCSNQPLGLDLVPTNNYSTNVMVNEFIEFNTPGMMESWTVPDGVNEIKIEVWGADGGNSTVAGGQPGGSGAYLERSNLSVVQGDVVTAYPGAAGQNGTTGGGGGGSAVTDPQGNLMVAAGGGGGAQTLGGGGQGTSATLADGAGGAGNGGGGGGGFTAAGSNGNGAQGGFGGAAGFNGAGGDGFSTGGDGGLGTGGGGGGSLLAGGGGGGHVGGNGGDGAFQLGGYGGGSFGPNATMITPGVNGSGLGQTGRVRISWTRTLPPITYTITSIDNPAGLGDGDGIDRSVAPDNVGVADVITGNSNLIADEQWINNTNDAQTVTYTIVPENDTQCGGEPFTVTVTVDPVPTATITTDAPMNMVCSGEDFEIAVNSLITVPSAYRWRRQLNGGSFTSWTNNVPFGTSIAQNFVNTTGMDAVYTYEIRPYTYGPDGINNSSGGDDCAGAIQTISIAVKSRPVMPTPANPALIVCSDEPFGSSFVSGLSSNGPPIGSINLLDITADAGLTYTGTPALPTLPANGLSLNDLNGHSWNNLSSGGLFVTYRIQHVSADGCTDDFVDYVIQIRAEPVLASGLDKTICSGGATDITLANDPGQGTQTIAGYNIVSIDFDGAFLTPGSGNAVPGTGLPASAIAMDTWTNSSDIGLPVTYLIAPVAAAPSNCVGDAVPVIVNVEPTPTASVDVTVGDDPTVTVTNANSPQAFAICSDATNFTLVASSTTIPTDPTHELWGRLRILGDVEIFDPLAMGTITLHGPIGNLAIASQPLINTSNAPKTITVRILPYIEITPGTGSPTYNAASECAGSEIEFTITVYPQPDFNDLEVVRCNEVSFGLDLDMEANNAGVGVNVQVPVSLEFDYTGAVQEWIVPEGVFSVTITAVGADGGNSNTRNGGSGATATRTQMVTPGETMYIVVGGAGTSGSVAGGGGGGTGVSYELPSSVILLAGGGGGASPSTDGSGGGDNNTGATTGGLAGVSNGGGGGGGYTGNGGSAGGQGGQLGAGANGGSFVLAGGWGFGGGGGGYQQTTFGAGGGGGGHRGGNGAGQFSSPPASIAQGGLSFRGPAPFGAITPGASGGGQAANGTVTLSFLQPVPAISYTIVDIDVPAGLSDADGNVLGFGDIGDGTLLENEAWTNTTDEFQTVTYTLSPVAASPLSVDGCPGENFEVSMIVEPTPRMALGNVTTISQYESYELTICSGETLNVPLSTPTTPSGGINLLQYHLISVTSSSEITAQMISVPDILGNASQNVVLNQTWENISTNPGTVTYVLRPHILGSPDCQGGDVTFTVTVLPQPNVPMPSSPANIVCSDVAIDLSSVITPLNNVPTTINLLGIVASTGLIYSGMPAYPTGFPVDGLTLTDLDLHSWNNTSMTGLFVTYEVEHVTADGCLSNPLSYTIQVRAEPVLANNLDVAICSGSTTGITLAVDPLVGYQPVTGFDIIDINYDPQTLDPAGNYTPLQNAPAGEIFSHSWVNLTNTAQSVVYVVAPRRDNGCVGDPVNITVVVEPDALFDLTLTHSGVPAGPQTINVNNAPAATPLALTICADSPFEASIAAAAVPSGNVAAKVWVSITDPDNLTGLGGPVDLMQSDLGAYLSFPSGISNPGAMPSTIQFRMRPYFDTNGNGVYDAGIDCDLGVFGYDLTVESAVVAQANVQANDGPDDEVCDEETFTVRLRKTTNSVPVASYLVWVEFGANLTQISASPLSTNPMNPTGFVAPTGGTNQVLFDASFSNASTSDQTVTYHIVPVSATGCLGAEITQVVTVYGRIEANPDLLGVCLGTTGTINSNVTGGGGGYTYTWTYQGGTARQFRINNQLFGNNPTPGTPLNNQMANLLLNANIQNGGILITLPGTILMDLLVEDANGCEESFSFTFVIAESPESGTTVPFIPTVCENGPIVDLFDLLAVGSYDLGGTWSQTGGPAEGILDPVNGTFDPVGITGLSPKIFMFTYTVNNGFCAPVSTEVTLSVQPNPQAGTYVGTPAYVCVGTSTYNLFNLLVPGSFEEGGFWTQTFGPTAIPILPNGDAFVSIGSPGNYIFRYAFAPVGICDGSEVFVNLVIESQANAGMVNPLAINEFCTGQSINLFTLITANQPGGVWSELTNSGGSLNPSTGVFNPSNVATGTYQFEYLIVGQAPCTGTDAVIVTVEIQETPSLTLTLELDGVLSATILATNSPVSRTICSGTEITLNATSPAMPMSGGEVWFAADIIDPGNMLGGLIPEYGPMSLFTDLMQTLTNSAGGLENVVITLTPYIETDPNGPLPQLDPNECFGESVSLLITVQETPQGDNLSLVLCAGDPLAVNLNNQINNNVFSNFEWSAADNPAVSGESTTTQTSLAITDVLVNNSNLPQTVVYTVTPISNDGCEGDPFTVEVLLENAFFTYTVSLDGFTYNFEDASFTGSAWTWNFGEGGVSSMQNPTHTFATPGTYNVCLEVTTDCGVLQYCEMIMVSGEVCDLVNLNAGLNLVSTDVDPADPSITTVFADLIATNNLVFVQGRNSAGAVVIFDPALPPFLNTLQQITPGEGYYVRVQSGATLEICGAPIDPAFKKDLNAGINIVGYVPQASTTPQNYFADLITTGNLVFARGYDLGFKIFDPALPPFLNTLTSIDNSFGYEMRLQFAVSGTNWLSDEDVANRDADADPLAQSLHYDVLAAISNLSDDATGGVVYLETETGLVLGTMEVLPGGYLMTTPVYGFDSGLDEIIELHPGDRIFFRYGTQLAETSVVYFGDKRIRLVEVNFNESPLNAGTIELKSDMFRVFPNPFASSFNLSYRLHSEARVSIRLVSVTGQLVDQLQAEILQPAGPYELRWNNTQYLSAGVYFVQVFVDGQPVANLPVVYQD